MFKLEKTVANGEKEEWKIDKKLSKNTNDKKENFPASKWKQNTASG